MPWSVSASVQMFRDMCLQAEKGQLGTSWNERLHFRRTGVIDQRSEHLEVPHTLVRGCSQIIALADEIRLQLLIFSMPALRCGRGPVPGFHSPKMIARL